MRFGYHVSLKGPPVSALLNGVAAGCDTIQMFPGSPHQWGTPRATEEQVEEFRDKKSESGIDPVIIHSIYLINMASPDGQVYKRSVSSLASALGKAYRLGCAAVVTHVGNHKGDGEEAGLARIAEAVGSCFEKAEGDAELLLETIAGAGTAIGSRFDQFGRVFEAAGWPPRLGFCLDTCHIFAAGYDISTPAGVDSALEELDRYVGLDRLKLLHLNDSKGECGSHLDRHEHIGKGEIGLESFRYMVSHPALKDLPAIIELPHPPEKPDAPDDISLLRSLQ